MELVQIASQATEQPADLSSPPSPARNTLRATAAFTLGVLGGETAESRLVELLLDSSREVRYNAATGLARHGREEAEGTLLEMLHSAGHPIGGAEMNRRDANWSREIVLRNALQSVQNLVAKNPEFDRYALATAVRRLTELELAAPILDLANRTLQALNAPQ